jgi:GlpG protein
MQNAINRYFSFSVLLIVICLIVAVLSRLGTSVDVLEHLFFARPGSVGLSDVARGELWRLVTPIFIHFGGIHLLFNMMWLFELGTAIEEKKGHAFLGLFVLAIGALSNLAQYLIGGSPFFGGMSGVVYGLLGYFWMQGRYNPNFGYHLHQSTVILMLGWYLLCWTGLLGPIANWAHTAGLVLGVVWGYLDSGRRRRRGAG